MHPSPLCPTTFPPRSPCPFRPEVPPSPLTHGSWPPSPILVFSLRSSPATLCSFGQSCMRGAGFFFFLVVSDACPLFLLVLTKVAFSLTELKPTDFYLFTPLMFPFFLFPQLRAPCLSQETFPTYLLLSPFWTCYLQCASPLLRPRILRMAFPVAFTLPPHYSKCFF